MKGLAETFFNDTTIFSEAVNAYLPGTAYVLLSQDGGTDLRSAVSKGDQVEEGQILAGQNSAAAIHSPVPGVVEDFVPCLRPDGKTGQAARIRLSGAFSYLGKPAIKTGWETQNKHKLCRILSEKGVLNLFSSPVPLEAEIRSLKKKQGRILVVRLNDQDPSQKTDSFIARQYQREIAEGAAILAKAADIQGVILLYDKNSPPPDREEFASQIHEAEIILEPVTFRQYFSGTLREIVSLVRKTHSDSVFASITLRDLFVDPATLLNVYRAVVFSLPVMESIVQISGSVVNKPGMFSIRNGTLIRQVLEECGGLTNPYSIMIVNGVIAGMSITSLDTPVTKYVKSIRFLHSWELPDQGAHECIRCGNCKAICPSGLEPAVLFSYMCGIKITEPAYIASAALCEDCVLCNTVCPSRLPLCQYISLLKETIVRET
jgi:electron transport complex protein RnfC